MGQKDHSFDIVSEVNLQEVTNAVEQARKEISTRYDLKDSHSSVLWDPKERKIEILTENDFRLKAVLDVLHEKLAKRAVSLKCLEMRPPERAVGGTLRQTISILMGIPQEKAKNLAQFIRGTKLKVQPQIQGEQIRVIGNKIDALQELMGLLKSQNFDLDLQFRNYR